MTDLKTRVMLGAARAERQETTEAEYAAWWRDVEEFIAAAKGGRYSRADVRAVVNVLSTMERAENAAMRAAQQLMRAIEAEIAALEGQRVKQIQTVRTPSGPLALIRPTAEKLLAEGVISGALDGDLHAADAATVKAAIMASSVCDFCSTPGASHFYDVPDFGVTQHPGSYASTRNTGGWMACDICHDLVQRDRRKDLVERAIATMAFPKFSRRAIEELYEKFWRGMEERAYAAGSAAALGDYIEARLPKFDAPKISDRDRRVEAVMGATGLTTIEIDDLLVGKVSRDAVAKLARFSERFGKDPRAAMERFIDGPRKPLADVMPHWQRALDAKFAALTHLESVIRGATDQAEGFADPTDLKDPAAIARMVAKAKARREVRNMGFANDVRFLRAAQAYSFNGETAAAIREAARGVPHDAPLSSIETPNVGAGWFWFADPLPIAASPVSSSSTHALLWAWTTVEPERNLTLDDAIVDRLDPDSRARLAALVASSDERNVYRLAAGDVRWLADALRRAGFTREELEARTTTASLGDPALVFSAYVLDERPGRQLPQWTPVPSARWTWRFSDTFQDMLAQTGAHWEATYGPGGEFEGEPTAVGKDATRNVVGDLSLFFVMACLWFKQTVPILTREAGQIERHARKRYAKEHKLADLPSVQVVALRRSARTPADGASPERREGAREYHHRWIVRGHPRLQACGPGRQDRKLIWIEAHPAGPPDKPLRTKERVYAVIR